MNTKSYEYCMIVTAVGPEQGHWWACTDLIFPDFAQALRTDGRCLVSEASWSYLGCEQHGDKPPVRLAYFGSPGWTRDYREGLKEFL